MKARVWKGFVIGACIALTFFQSERAGARKADAVRRPVFSTPEQSTIFRNTPAPGLELAPLAVADTVLLGWYSFDSGGIADPQGWTSVDRTEPVEAPFHVADASELNGGNSGTLTPLSGTQSLWCGVAPGTASPFCHWATLPGYGNNWAQTFESTTFAVSGDVTFSYAVRWDSEAAYDETVVQYWNPLGPWGSNWVDLPVNGGIGFYDGSGNLTESLVITSETHGGALKLRFLFTSDGAWSDEDGLFDSDGAVLIDDILITDATGTVDIQDFESEPAGATATTDGHWSAGTTPSTAFGDFAALYPGATVLQEDLCVREIDYIWGFFDDPSISFYDCYPNHPEQGAIRRGDIVDNHCLEIQNEIWSPPIALTGSGAEFLLSFRVYRDLPLDGLIFYTWHVRSQVDGCWRRWENAWPLYYGSQRDWLRQELAFGQFVDPSASHIQVALGVIDMCSWWCIFGCGDAEGCHTHAPLFDDVYVLRIDNPAPQFAVNHVELFQDNFAEDGTVTGTARADAAQDILPASNGNIIPGDSLTATIIGGPTALASDPHTGVGPAAYAYVTLWPQGQPDKSGTAIEAPESRGIGKRFPLVETIVNEQITWYRFRMDTCVTATGERAPDCYCVDLNDNVFNPGDTIEYVLAATNSSGVSAYFSRRLNGQGVDFVTTDLAAALASPMEFTILPAGGWIRGGDILYVDDADDRAGPPQLFFDTAFDLWAGLSWYVDRYDVLGPSAAAGNSLASRVTDPFIQIVAPYRTIIWSTSNLHRGLIGDGGPANGGSSVEKSDDWTLLWDFIDVHVNMPGVYLSGDDLASEWAGELTGTGAVNFRSVYMNFDLDPAGDTPGDNSHHHAGEPLSPMLTGVAPCAFGDQLIAYGGCPVVDDFDLLLPTGASTPLFQNTVTGRTYALFQATPNSAGSTARVVLSGFSFDNVRDVGSPSDVPARATHLYHIVRSCLIGGTFGPPSGIRQTPQLANRLEPAYPNPFNPSTTIRYSIQRHGHVRLAIYNVAGQRIQMLVDEVQSPRAEGFVVEWNGQTHNGGIVPSGVYFCRLETAGFIEARKIVLIK